jgi:aminopeptidase S
MRTRIPNGRVAVLCAALIALAGILAGCSSGDDTFNPALIQGAGNSASFSMAVTPPSVTVAQGQTAPYTVTLTATNGFSSPVSLSVSGMPAGASSAFSTTSVAPTSAGATSTLTITTAAGGPGSLEGTIRSSAATPPGTSTLTVTATGAGITKQATVTLIVTAASS